MSSTIAINLGASSSAGLNLQQLKQSECFGEEYGTLLSANAGSLTQVYGHDVASTFAVAKHDLRPNEAQTEILNIFLEKFFLIEDSIDPERLLFTITKAMDDEICINRKAALGGRVKIIINDDGVMAFSFLPDPGSGYKPILDFYSKDNVDFKGLSYLFFGL